MTDGQYHIVKFSPDPIRDEPLNIGIVMTGNFDTLVSFPEDALERAAKWCRTLDPDSLVDLRDSLEQALRRAGSRAQDLDGVLRTDFLGERFGPITLSEPRWVDLGDDSDDDLPHVFEYLTSRIVSPPKPISYGGGAAASVKLAKAILPTVRRVFPSARTNEQILGHSGRIFTADVYAPGPKPLIMATMVPSSSWQGIRAVEAKAFELVDVAKATKSTNIAVCLSLPRIDPEGVGHAAHAVFRSVNARVVTPETLHALEQVQLS